MRTLSFLWLFLMFAAGCQSGLQPVDTDGKVDDGPTDTDTEDNGATYSVGGNVAGLIGTVVLTNNGGDDLTIGADGAFTFAKRLTGGAMYDVAVKTQPANQACTVAAGTGNISGADVNDIKVTCATNMFTLGGSMAGLSGTVVLQNNGGSDVTVSSNGGWEFANYVQTGTSYAVTVGTQPSGQTCTVTNGTGTMPAADVADVAVTCADNIVTHSIGGNLSGLTAGSVTLQNNGGDDLTLTSDGSFTFATEVVSGNGYNVTVSTQPAGLTCVVTNGTGTATSTVLNVAVACAPTTYEVGGTVADLIGTVELQNNGGDTLTVTANGSYAFATELTDSTNYTVTVLTQPTGQNCQVSNGTGTINGNDVTNVDVTCTKLTYNVGGMLAGASGPVTLLNNGGDALVVNADGGFTFTTKIPFDDAYAVTVQSTSNGQVCSVSNGTGTMGATDVTDVQVTCSSSAFNVGGTLIGLSGTLVLQNNGGDDLTLTADAGFTFNTAVADGAGYAVTVFSEPPGQTCTVTNGSGTISGASVTDVAVRCENDTHTVSGTVSGLSGTLVLQNNNTDDLTLTADGVFTFSTALDYGTTYAVTVQTQPSGATCTVTNGTGTITGDVADVMVDCGLTCPGDDASEPNDSWGGAATVASTSSTDGILCSSNADWFTTTVAADCILDVDLRFVHADGDLSLTLYDDSGAELFSTDTATDDEALTWIVGGASQDLTVEISASTGVENLYTLDLSSTCQSVPPTCTNDDIFEPNDSLTQAVPLNPGHTTLSGVTCSNEDWYRFDLAPGCWVSADATFTNANGDLDLYIRDSNQVAVDAGVSSDDNERVDFHADAMGTWFLQVLGYQNASNDYVLDVDIVCPDGAALACPANDHYEDNDSDLDAVPLNPVSNQLDGIVCTNDYDVFEVDVLAGCQLDVGLTFDNVSGDLDFDLYDSATDDLIGIGWSSTDNEAETFVAAADGTVEIWVYSYLNQPNDYTLTTQLSCPTAAPTCPTDDVYEDNDTYQTGTPLNFSDTFLLAASCQDDDWYWQVLPAGCWMYSQLDFTHANGDLDYYAYAGSAVVGFGATTGDTEWISYHADPNGSAEIIDLLAVGYLTAENTYQLSSWIECPASGGAACPADDHLEPNDTWDAGVPLNILDPLDLVNAVATSTDTVIDGAVCANSDWYFVDLPANCAISASLTHTNASGNLDLDLYQYNSWVTPVASSATTNNVESFNHTATASDRYYVEVSGSTGAESNTYTLDVTASCP